MKLYFEEWLDSQGFSEISNNLFQESLKCYRISAYNASFLFSYLAFFNIIKERLSIANCPNGIPASKWDKIQRDIQNAETWDKTVFETIIGINPASVFILQDNLRNEIKYWKDKRNDCAHFKQVLDYYHVESFWKFLKTNLSKFVINGSYQSLIQKFQRHFDPSFTRPGESYQHLVAEIEHAISSTETVQFFEEIKSMFRGSYQEPYIEIFNSIIENYNNHLQENLISYISKDLDEVLKFTRKYPDKFSYFKFTNQQVRNIWFEKLFKDNTNDFPILCSILNNDLIESQDIEEAFKSLIEKNTGYIPTNNERFILEAHKFYSTFKSIAFREGGLSGFEEANNLSTMIIHYMTDFEIDIDMVKSINSTLSAPLPSRELINKLKLFLKKNPSKESQILDIIKNNNIYVGAHLKFIENNDIV